MVRRVSPVLVRQFDICRLGARGPSTAGLPVVVLQHDELDNLATLIVAPLLGELPSEVHPNLHPQIWLGGSPAFLFVDRMSAIRRSEINAVVGNAQEAAWAIKRAIDTTFFGF